MVLVEDLLEMRRRSDNRLQSTGAAGITILGYALRSPIARC